jgi:hypothetical protein
MNRAALLDQIRQARATLEKLLTLPQERCVISSFKIAESMGFKGHFRQWEELLRVDE